ncbi:oxidoreductase [Sneathiella sp.]|uniref:oxidoreductase n=1 Tax=Sneathiella sp. TaxID=1964365 RepID=UPI0025F9C8F2|nr:NADPH-dependent 2,4-dienoyl-CoA reductase [Sneathiella sp.]
MSKTGMGSGTGAETGQALGARVGAETGSGTRVGAETGTGTGPAGDNIGKKFPHLSSPFKIGSMTLANRMIMGSMHTRMETMDRPLEREIAFYEARARGGIGMIVTGGFAPNSEGLIDPGCFVMNAEIDRGYHQELTSAVKQHDVRFVAQLLHAGRYAKIDNCVAPSAIKAPINPRTPRGLTTVEVWQTIDDFRRAALMARDCGYEGVELMGSEGYLLNQFLSARTNHRDDAFGGSWEHRRRFPLEIVRAIRAAAGDDFPIMFRMSMLELVDGGMSQREIFDLAHCLQAAGVDSLTSGIGWHEARVPTVAQVTPRAAFKKEIAAVKAVVDIPVIATNRINMPEVGEALLREKVADAVYMARPLLADADYARKVLEGRDHLINTCIACNQACLDHIFVSKVPTCLVNPRALRELEFPEGATQHPENIAVIGGGVAGMVFAMEAAARGHRITLFEKAATLGGLLNLARVIPGKGEFNDFIRYLSERLVETGVDVRLGVTADPPRLSGYDRVVLATGVVPRQLSIDGISHPSVASYEEVLSGKVTAGARVAVIGAGGIGFDTVEYLLGDGAGPYANRPDFEAEYGLTEEPDVSGGFRPDSARPGRPAREIVMLQRSEGRLGKTLSITTDWIKRAKIAKANVRMLAGVEYRRIDDAGLHITVNGAEETLDVDTIIICAGQISDTSLEKPLRQAGLPVHMIGGALFATELDAQRAVDEATRLALSL